MKIAFVIQRYGSDVLGGSEQLCRLLAERLSLQHDVEVITTCARDYVTWRNEYPEGADRIRGVTVRRFATARTRNQEEFNKFSDWIYHHPHTADDEMEWLKLQGPWSPALVDFLRRSHQQYDVVVFFTYLYATTVLGMEACGGRGVLVPTAHDEPAIGLNIYKQVFGRAAALCYLTDAERHVVQRRFPDRPLLEELIGVGVDVASATDSPIPLDRDLDEPLRDDEAPTVGHLDERGAGFRRRHRLSGNVVLYGGRIDPGKGCEELLAYFGNYIQRGGLATLALMGVKLMSIPEDPHVRFAGLLSDGERSEALEAATVVVCPSPYESLSLLALEAMAVGTPVLVNGQSPVLVEHCRRSHAGLWYENQDEFVEGLDALLLDPLLRETLGRQGREYVKRHYRWDVVLNKYERIFAKARLGR